MINYIREISKSDKDERLRQLKHILHVNEIPYEVICQKIGNHWADNVRVSFCCNTSFKRFIFCAHYDNYEGSSGANDNASGVSILIKLAIKAMQMKITKNIEILFFDREECEDRGSEQYIQSIGEENIIGAINFDTCGYGNRILLGPSKNLSTDIFSFISKDELIDKHKIELIKRTPGSDDRSFENKGVPNLSICVVPEGDIPIIHKLIDYEIMNINPTIEEFLDPPEFISTTHNGMNDNISVVQETALDMLYNFASEILETYFKE